MAVTYPTAPIAVSISVSASLRPVPIASATAFNAYVAGTDGIGPPRYGDDVILTAGIFYPNLSTLPVLTGVLGDGTNYCTIRSSLSGNLPSGTRAGAAQVASMARVTRTTSSAVLTFANGAHHYRFIGLEILSASVTGVASIVQACPSGTDILVAANYLSKLSFERCYIHADYDYGATKGLVLGGSDIQVIDSDVDDIKKIGEGDANAIWIAYSGTGPYKLDNNHIAGMGENVFTGGSSDAGIAVTAGYEYVIPKNITITNNYIRRKLSWKRDHATYVAPCNFTGSATILTAVGAILTFNAPHGLISDTYAGLGIPRNVKPTIKDVVTEQYRQVLSIDSGTQVTLTSAFSTSPVGHAWRYNRSEVAATSQYSQNLDAKNVVEFKAGQYILIENNYIENVWPDGQQFDLTLTPREFGWISDVEVRYNRFTNCSGPSLGVGDPNAGSGFGPSPYPMSRLWIHHNQWDAIKAAAMTALSVGTYCSFISTGTDTYGTMQSVGGTIQALDGSVGTARTFTSPANGDGSRNNPFAASLVNNEIRMGTGIGVVKTFVDANTIRVDISSAFSTSPTATAQWYIAKVGMVKTAQLIADSWVLEHNSWIGPSSNFSVTHLLYKNSGNETAQKGTNFIYRDNIAFHGADPNNVTGGIRGDASTTGGGQIGSTACTHWWDVLTAIVTNNVFFGPQTLTGNHAYTYWTSPYVGVQGPGSTSPTPFSASAQIAFHDPSVDGGNGSSGIIGFTNYASGNYLLTGTYATAATDGTMIGPDTAALTTRLANVLTGSSSGGSSPSGAPGALGLAGVGARWGLGLTPGTP